MGAPSALGPDGQAGGAKPPGLGDLRETYGRDVPGGLREQQELLPMGDGNCGDGGGDLRTPAPTGSLHLPERGGGVVPSRSLDGSGGGGRNGPLKGDGHKTSARVQPADGFKSITNKILHGGALAKIGLALTIGYVAQIVSTGATYKSLEGPVFGTKVGIFDTNKSISLPDKQVIVYKLPCGAVEECERDDGLL